MSDHSPMELDQGPFGPETLRSETFAKLRDGPKTSDELHCTTFRALRDSVGRLKPPQRSSGGGARPGAAKAVYYLWGDERRAVRKFIDVNPQYAETVVESSNDGSNILQYGWDEGLYQLFREEWQSRRVTREGGGDS